MNVIRVDYTLPDGTKKFLATDKGLIEEDLLYVSSLKGTVNKISIRPADKNVFMVDI